MPLTKPILFLQNPRKVKDARNKIRVLYSNCKNVRMPFAESRFLLTKQTWRSPCLSGERPVGTDPALEQKSRIMIQRSNGFKDKKSVSAFSAEKRTLLLAFSMPGKP